MFAAFRGKLAALVLFATTLFVLGLSSPCWAQGATAPETRAILETIGRLPALRPSDTSRLMAAIGYRTTLSPSDWSGLSPSEQLRAAYNSAQAGPTPQGDIMLARAARYLAERYESARFDPVLRPLLAQASTGEITYGNIGLADAQRPIPASLRGALNALSVYVEGVGAFSRPAVLRRHFGIDFPELANLLEERNTSRMLQQALERAPIPPPPADRVARLGEAILATHESAAVDASTRAVVDDLKRQVDASRRPVFAGVPLPPETAPTGGGGDEVAGGEGGGSPERRRAAAARNADFDARHYPTSESRSFNRVLARAGGRGGIVAGAAVDAVNAPGRPRGILFETEAPSCPKTADSTFGSLIIVMQDGRQFRYGPVACDEARAALQAVFGDGREVPAWRPGEAIGLATIDPGRGGFYVPKSGSLQATGKRFSMILHPALVDVGLGASVAFADLLPSADGSLLSATGRDPAIVDWLRDMSDFGTWRWHDRPLRLRFVNTMVFVEGARTPSEPALQLRVFTVEEMRDEAASQAQGVNLVGFDKAAPVLMRRVAQYRRLDSFLRTLALVRWVRLNGGGYMGRLPALEAPRPRTPSSLVVSVDGRIRALVDEPSLTETCNTLNARKGELPSQPEEIAMAFMAIGVECRLLGR